MGVRIIRPLPVIETVETVQKPELFVTLDEFIACLGARKLVMEHKQKKTRHQVKDWNAKEKRVTLLTSDGLIITPVLAERECRLYDPVWVS